MRVKVFFRVTALCCVLAAICTLAGCRKPQNVQEKLPTQAEVQAQLKAGLEKVDKDKSIPPEDKEKLKMLAPAWAGSRKTRDVR